MAPQTIRGFPLFPLGIVALPTESVPLHIFEDRYRKLIEHCLEGEQAEFGILWLSDEELKRVGCACTIEQRLDRMEDGRMNIVVRRALELLERQDDLPFPAGAVAFLDEDLEQPDEDGARSARELYRTLVKQATDRELTDSELMEMTAYRMAATVEFEIQDKQQLLETRSENARLGMLAGLLSAALERLDLVERAQMRAMSNGKVKFG